MNRPDLSDLETKCHLLGQIAERYQSNSPEELAILAAAHALQYIQHLKLRDDFQSWVDRFQQPPTALQVLHARLAGVKIPHELLEESVREIDQVLERLQFKRQ